MSAPETSPQQEPGAATAELPAPRRLPVGAEVVPGGVSFRVWAPGRRQVEVVFEEPAEEWPVEMKLAPEPSADNGYFSGLVEGAGEGALYKYRLDGGDAFPDPASRFQPAGPHGPSQVVDPSWFPWTDAGWQGLGREGQVIYEMHLGTFTPEGTWEAAARKLPALAELGITVLEVMPVAEFPGRFGWGYDGVDLYAPYHLYGGPDDFRRFVDRAHALGLGVILDVVYNHLGPDGNYLKQLSEQYFTDKYENDWGQALNFEGPEPVREFFIANAGYWIDEYHLDGLRLDATQDVKDASEDHVLAAIGRRARAAAGGRRIYMISENEPQDTRLVRPPEQGGYGLDALWNDDFHHSAMVALTGRHEAYYTDYRGTPQEMISLVKYGFLYQGQRYSWQEQRRGTPGLGLPASAFVDFLQNHDQVANSARGERVHRLASPSRYRALTALLLLGPGTPLLFQGQEFGASTPFLYFADHDPELAAAVRRGRLEFLAQFPSLALAETQAGVPDPESPQTFARCKLDWTERETNAAAHALHRDLLRLRREDPVFRAQGAGWLDGAVLGSEAFVLRFFGENAGDRLLIVNLGGDLELEPVPEPLLAPLTGRRWEVLWSSEDPRYGGSGAPPPEDEEGCWRLAGQSAVALRLVPLEGVETR
ncbi:MAG TPA: malto-oligosyltrehalose trehalohydrolase [Thermoanaerobaculia bacterium]|jgi:maltooligosyltrehalose trehalohydrolase|nr:malto-oligosyltrehalose trehalohydrolase [Thermoanaerobaculia bacterium]